MSVHDDRFKRDDFPAHTPRVTPIRKIKATDQIVFSILATWIEGFWTHWVGSTTRPCMVNGDEPCEWCQKNAPKKWAGYLFGYDHQKGELAFLEMTTFGFEKLQKLFPDEKNLRGRKVTVQRERKSEKAPIYFVDSGYVHESLVQVKERSVLPTLKRIWKQWL